MEDSAKFELDQSAATLYRQFAGLDEQERVRQLEDSALMQHLLQEEKQLDYYRLLLAETTASFVGVLANSRFAALAADNQQKVKVLISTLDKLGKFPKFGGKIHCRLRGQQCPDGRIGSEVYDYELALGNFLLDFQMARMVSERAKDHGAMINAKLLEAFQALSAMKIFNFSIDLGQRQVEDLQKINRNLHHLIHFYGKGADDAQFVVRDEYEQPHINLTMLAAYNRIQPAVLQGLVNKIKPRLVGESPDPQLLSFTTAYDVIFSSHRNRELLKKMPIEVNNVQWLTQQINTPPEKTAQAVQASRFVLAKFGSNPRMAYEVLSSIKSDGYGEIRTEVMGKRLARATDFLKLSEARPDREDLHGEALQNIEAGMAQIPDNVYDRIHIHDDGRVSTVDDQGQKTGWDMHEKISGLLRFFKQRSTTKKKVREIASNKVIFDAADYAVIARNFQVSEGEAARLLDLLKSCFDDLGHFRRTFFEKNIPQFVKFGNKVFEFLWHYLKELDNRNDRVAFLNAMQPLVAGLSHPQDALQVLLADIFNRSGAISYSDRNGLILATLLLRQNGWQTRSQIELTPEEVLKVREGLDQEMLKAVTAFLEQNQDSVINKFRMITESLLKKASAGAELAPGEMAPRFLLLLQREMVIFLALAGGESSLAIIQGVVRDFGNPESTYYQAMGKKENMRHSLQLLQVAVRCLRRFEDPQALSLIDVVASRSRDFIMLCEDPAHHLYVKKVMEEIRKVD